MINTSEKKATHIQAKIEKYFNKPATTENNFSELNSIFSTLKDTNSIVAAAYSTSLIYFLAGGVISILLILLPRIQSISGGGLTIALNALQEEVKEVKATVNEQQKDSAKQLPKDKSALFDPTADFPSTLSHSERHLLEASASNDPQKGQWGGLSERNGRRLSATVKPTASREDLYDVVLKVESIIENLSLTGAVKFHLHPTFFNSNPIIFVQDGKTELKLVAWGAFTVGAETDNENTQLELDLADEKWGFPEAFRNQ